MAAATASAFPDPDTTSHTSRDRWAAGNVSVMRRGGGLGESRDHHLPVGLPDRGGASQRTVPIQTVANAFATGPPGKLPHSPHVAGAKADRNRGPVGAGEQLEDAVQAELVADLECDRPKQVDPVDGGGAGLVGL